MLDVICKGCGRRFRREDVVNPDTNPMCTKCLLQPKYPDPLEGVEENDTEDIK